MYIQQVSLDKCESKSIETHTFRHLWSLISYQHVLNNGVYHAAGSRKRKRRYGLEVVTASDTHTALLHSDSYHSHVCVPYEPSMQCSLNRIQHANQLRPEMSAE